MLFNRQLRHFVLTPAGEYLSDQFFFSSSRRHTTWPRDWSSDVCSSDLKTQMSCATGIQKLPFDEGGLRDDGGQCAGAKIGRASCREREEFGVKCVTRQTQH